MKMINNKRQLLKISNSLSIEDNIHYKRIRKQKPLNLTRNANINISINTTFTIIQSGTENESIFVFQDMQKSKSSVFLFENEEDANVFVTLLEAETTGLIIMDKETKPKCLKVHSDDIVELCKENGFNCYFHPSGSLVTPMNMEV